MNAIKIVPNGIVYTRESIADNKRYSMEIKTTPDKLKQWLNEPEYNRPFIQDFFPELNADEREFLLTGVTPEEWDKLCNDPRTSRRLPSRPERACHRSASAAAARLHRGHPRREDDRPLAAHGDGVRGRVLPGRGVGGDVMSNPGEYYDRKRREAEEAHEFIRICKADIAACEDPENLRILGKRLAALASQLDLALYVGD